MLRYIVLSCALALLLLASLQILTAPAQATTTITVTTTQDVIADDGWCSLREAVIAANTDSAFHDCPGGSGADTIDFGPGLPATATYVLTRTGAGEDAAMTGDLDIQGTLSLDGLGAGSSILDGDGGDRIFEILPGGQASISGVTVRNGNPGSGAYGGGIGVNLTGALTLTDSTVTGNTAVRGGGIYILGRLTASNSLVDANQGGGLSNDGGLLVLDDVDVTNNTGGHGIRNESSAALLFTGGLVSGNQQGGIYNDSSSATLTDVTIANNTGGGGVYSTGIVLTRLKMVQCTVTGNAATSGGGIHNEGIGAKAEIYDTRISSNTVTSGGGGVLNNGIMTLEGSTIDHNRARSGGGINHVGGNLYLTNDTLSANSAGDNGGGLLNRGSAVLTNVTFKGNTASDTEGGSNIFVDEAQLAIENSIVAHATAGGNCANSAGLITSLGHNLDSGNTCGFAGTGDINNTDPHLGPLQDNGGATWTHALLAGSQAANAGDNGGCPATDQRGVPRPQGAVCDIGSYERILDGEAELSIAKVDAVDPVTEGDGVTYTVTVGNNGPDTALNAVLTDSLPGGVVFVSATPGQGSCGEVGGVVTCNLGDIASGGRVDVVIVVTASAAGVITNNAGVTSDTVDLNDSNDNASEDTTVKPAVGPEADLSIAKVDSPDPVTAGAPLTYTLFITNTGLDAATTVAVTDELPLGVTFGSASGAGWSCEHAGGVVTCTRPGLAVGAAPSIAITVTAPARSGPIANTATVSSLEVDPNARNNTARANTQVKSAYKVYLPLVLR